MDREAKKALETTPKKKKSQFVSFFCLFGFVVVRVLRVYLFGVFFPFYFYFYLTVMEIKCWYNLAGQQIFHPCSLPS